MTNSDVTTEETWQTIAAFPNYQVSQRGNVRRAICNKYHPAIRVLRIVPDSDGYGVVTLYRDKVPSVKKAHRLVAEAFIGPCPVGHEVNHKDGNKLNNHFSNLEYLTPEQNQRHAAIIGLKAAGDRNAMRKYPHLLSGKKNGNTKLTDCQVQEIRASNDSVTNVALAKIYGVTPATVRRVRVGLTFKNLPA